MRSQGWSQLCHPPRYPIPPGRTSWWEPEAWATEQKKCGWFSPQDGPGGFAGEVWALGRGWRREGVLQGATPLGLGGREPPRCHYLERLGNHFGKVRAERAQLPESFHLAHLDQDPVNQETSVRPSTGPSEPTPLPQETLPKQTFSSQQHPPRAALGEGPDRRSVTAVRCPAAWKGGVEGGQKGLSWASPPASSLVHAGGQALRPHALHSPQQGLQPLRGPRDGEGEDDAVPPDEGHPVGQQGLEGLGQLCFLGRRKGTRCCPWWWHHGAVWQGGVCGS